MTQDEIEKKQKESLGKLWRYFDYNKSKMARELECESSAVVNNWFKRGRISSVKAIKAEEITERFVTKEELRPDVTEWYA